MPLADYLAGLAWIAIVGLSLGRAAIRLRAMLIVPRSAAGGRLAACVLFLTLLLTLGQLLGAIGCLSWWTVLLGSVVLATIIEVVARGRERVSASSVGEPPPGGVSTRFEALTAAGCIAAVGWQWTTHMADAFDRGMVQADNLWYHGPFTAHFLQTHGFGDLGTLGYPAARSYPFDAELLHGMMTMPFGRDLLVPAANHLFAALALGASFVAGRRWGVGALAMIATSVVLSLPVIASTQPGQMYNDVMATALILAAIALLIEGGIDVGYLVVAGAGLGASVGTKLSVVAVAGTLFVGVLAVVLIARRGRTAIAWLATVAVTGGFWFARNWVVHGSPVPFMDVTIGPIDLPALGPAEGVTLLDTLDEFGSFRDYYVDSLDVSFGPLWHVTLLIAVGGCVALLARVRDWRFLAAAAATFGLLTFPMLPATGELAFVNNVRYAVTAVSVGLVLSALSVARGRAARVVLAIGLATCVVTNLFAPHRGRVAAWPGFHLWGFAFAAAVLVAGALAITWTPHRRLDQRRTASYRRLISAGVALGVAAVAVGAWYLQRHYLEHRYVDSGLPADRIYRPFADVRATHVDVLGTREAYAMFGTDLSNRVTIWTDHLYSQPPADDEACRFWRTELGSTSGYITVANGWLLPSISPEQRAAWFGRDPSVRTVYDDGERSVYHHDRPLDPARCDTRAGS